MDWTFENKPYKPTNEIKGIVYLMEWNGFYYIGKKQLTNKANKSTNWQTYMGSGKEWLAAIQGHHDEVKRTVLWECHNKSELHYYENYELYSRHALFDPKSYNKNVSMVVNERNSKNFKNKPVF